MTWPKRWRFPWYGPDESDKLLRETLAKVRAAAKDAGDGDAPVTLSLIDREGIEWTTVTPGNYELLRRVDIEY